MTQELHQAVRRVLARDDLLTMAAAADAAVDIAHGQQTLSRPDSTGKNLFDIALELLLKQAKEHWSRPTKAQAWDYAAVLLRFCELVGAPHKDVGLTPEQMHEHAMAELEDDETGLHLGIDMVTGAFNRHHAARNLRLIGRFEAALELANLSPEELWGAGAEPRTGHFLYEHGAIYIQSGRAAEIRRQLAEMDSYYENNLRASEHSSRYRLDFIRGLAQWDVNPQHKDVRRLLSVAIERLRDPERKQNRTDDARHDSVRELSVLMAKAEYLAATRSSDEDVAEAVELGGEALRITDEVRARWRVLARSKAPLARIFERVYGDLALLAHSLPGPEAAALGLRVAVAAKQTGFAVRIRDGMTFNGNPAVDTILRQIVEVEGSAAGAQPQDPETRRRSLEDLRRRLVEAVSPMLEDTVFPSPVDLPGLIETLGPRYALDFVELRDTLEESPRLYRTLIEPGGRLRFDVCTPAAEHRKFLESGRLGGDLARGIARAEEQSRGSREIGPEDAAEAPPIDWRALAKDVLPERLTTEILSDVAGPVRLLISAHSWLSLVPWAALMIDDDGLRLVQRAIISQTPILTCLSDRLPPPVTGRALIRLVGRDEGGVNIDLERQAWGFSSGTDGIPLHQCDLRPGMEPAVYPGRFDAALSEAAGWQFVHIASHGDGTGFGQCLNVPEKAGEDGAGQDSGQTLSAARALGLTWPTSVLMASCHVGQVINANGSEPLSFVMAVLTGGARCVVAGIDRIDDDGTGHMAHDIVRAIRSDDPPSLEVALHDAQIAALASGTRKLNGWALLSAHIC